MGELDGAFAEYNRLRESRTLSAEDEAIVAYHRGRLEQLRRALHSMASGPIVDHHLRSIEALLCPEAGAPAEAETWRDRPALF
jgi:hypothetical protein